MYIFYFYYFILFLLSFFLPFQMTYSTLYVDSSFHGSMADSQLKIFHPVFFTLSTSVFTSGVN